MKRIKKGKSLLLTLAVAAIMATTAQAAEPQADATAPAGSLVAKVNGVGISQTKLDQGILGVLKQRQLDPAMVTKESPQYKGMKPDVLNELVSQELLWQEARSAKRVVAEEVLEKAVSGFASKFDDKADFVKNLKQSGMTEEAFTKDLNQRLSVRRLIQEEVVSKVEVSQQEIDDFYQQNPDRFISPEQVRVRHILIKPEEGDEGEAQVLARIGSIAEAIEQGTDFAEAAKLNSQGPSASQGGDLGFAGRGQFVKPFEEAAFALQDGEVSAPIKTRFGYHLIKLEERRVESKMPLADAEVKIRQYLGNQKSNMAIRALVSRLWADAEVVLVGPL